MDRWHWMVARMYAPAAGMLALSFAVTLPATMLHASPLLAGIADLLHWASLACMAAAGLLWGASTYKLWRWERGQAVLTCDCGGLLGRERDGRYGIYRRCLACSRNINERNWA